MIKNLKAKERKGKQDLDFQYPKVVKITSGSKQDAKPIEQTTKDEEVLDVNDYVLPQPTHIRKSWIFP